MRPLCKYCNEPVDKQNKAGLNCDECCANVHLTCFRRPGTPGDLSGDVFFKFTCEDCSKDKKEVFIRLKYSWVIVIYLTLHHLSSQLYGISHHGYFHYKTHICSFIDRNWHILFGSSNKQKKNWIGTIAGVLSVYNKLFFKSGSSALCEPGWWRLMHNFSPAVAAHIIQEIAKDKPKNRPRHQPSLEKNYFFGKIIELGYKDLINEDVEEAPVEEPTPVKKRRIDSEESSGTSYHIDYDSSSRTDFDEIKYEDCQVMAPSELFESDYQDLMPLTDQKGFEITNFTVLPSHTVQSDTSSVTSYQNSALLYESDSLSSSELDKKPPVEVKPKKTAEDKVPVRRESLFSTELNSEGFPWDEKEEPNPTEELVEMTQYEEIQLLKKIEGMISKVKDPSKRAYLYRFKAKLALRRLKRHKHLPLFDLDKTVKMLGGYATEFPSEVINAERVLDRFQRSYLLERLSGAVCGGAGGAQLVAAPRDVTRSPYSGAALKPYIRRDAHARPLWIRLMDELLTKTNRHIKDYKLPARATLDYSYVQPHHIAAVNNLCAQYFWPGIDLSEALQYPEFSCVVSWSRVVVGCAFLVPDSSHTEAYISFVLTRPEWRRAGIATFMLYHLLQTCTGKDVTLHVSPTNPAIFLYQKFGFKVEEMIQDFYEKYYDIDYKGCRHALFLRLVR